MASSSRDQVFICYAHKDVGRYQELVRQLKPLQIHKRVKVWSDKDLDPGQKWKKAIEDAIRRARVAILLVSPNFLFSDFITHNELPEILNAAEHEGLAILWVHLSASNYKHTAISHYQAVHDVGKPMDDVGGPRGRNKIWVKLCDHIIDLLAPDPSTETTKKPDPPKPSAKLKLGDRQLIELTHGESYAMLWVPPGSFMMGSPETELERSDDETLHKVQLTRGFWLGETVVTQAQWQAVMGSNPSYFKAMGLPVDSVSWHDCQAFLAKLNALIAGGDFRLPTEAEWEYACRAGTETPFSFGTNITSEQVNFDGTQPYAGGKETQARGRTVPVTSLPANPWGFYEMHGNVWEWCRDWEKNYQPGEQVDPTGPDKGLQRVLRGGSWYDDGWLCRSALRNGNSPGFRFVLAGFRLARGQKVSGAS